MNEYVKFQEKDKISMKIKVNNDIAVDCLAIQ